MNIKKLDLDKINELFSFTPFLIGRVLGARFYQLSNYDKGLIMWLGDSVYETDLMELPAENDLLYAVLNSEEG